MTYSDELAIQEEWSIDIPVDPSRNACSSGDDPSATANYSGKEHRVRRELQEANWILASDHYAAIQAYYSRKEHMVRQEYIEAHHTMAKVALGKHMTFDLMHNVDLGLKLRVCQELPTDAKTSTRTQWLNEQDLDKIAELGQMDDDEWIRYVGEDAVENADGKNVDDNGDGETVDGQNDGEEKADETESNATGNINVHDTSFDSVHESLPPLVDESFDSVPPLATDSSSGDDDSGVDVVWRADDPRCPAVYAYFGPIPKWDAYLHTFNVDFADASGSVYSMGKPPSLERQKEFMKGVFLSEFDEDDVVKNAAFDSWMKQRQFDAQFSYAQDELKISKKWYREILRRCSNTDDHDPMAFYYTHHRYRYSDETMQHVVKSRAAGMHETDPSRTWRLAEDPFRTLRPHSPEETDVRETEEIDGPELFWRDYGDGIPRHNDREVFAYFQSMIQRGDIDNFNMTPPCGAWLHMTGTHTCMHCRLTDTDDNGTWRVIYNDNDHDEAEDEAGRLESADFMLENPATSSLNDLLVAQNLEPEPEDDDEIIVFSELVRSIAPVVEELD